MYIKMGFTIQRVVWSIFYSQRDFFAIRFCLLLRLQDDRL